METGLRKRNYIFIAFSIGIAGLALFLAFQLTPWFYAINTRVRLYLSAPADSKISICWDKSQTQCLPFVPYSTTQKRIAQPGEVADIWLSELPPRPKYTINIVFNSNITNAKFFMLELDSNQVLLFGDGFSTGVGNIQIGLDDFKSYSVPYKTVNNISHISAIKGSLLSTNKDIYQGKNGESNNWPSILQVWALLFSALLIICIPAYLLPYTMNNIGSAVTIANNDKLPGWVFVIFGGLATTMILLVKNSGVLMSAYDPFGYIYLALGGGWFDDVRLPGYPLFLGLTLAISNNSLNGVILSQAVFLGMSVIACVYALRSWIRPLASIIFVILCLFSPAQIYWARWILRESIFTSLVLLGITAAILHFTSEKPISNFWLLVFSAICGIAFLVRENGLLLPVVLLPGLVPLILNQLNKDDNILDRLRSVFLLSIRYVGPLIILGIIYSLFSGINYIKYGYFQVGRHQTSHAYLVRAIYPANSDARSLLHPGESIRAEVRKYNGWQFYSSYILARDQESFDDPIYLSLFPSVLNTLAADGITPNILYVAHLLNEMGREMNNLVPQRARVAGMLREYKQILSVHRFIRYSSTIGAQASLGDLKEYLKANGLSRKMVEELQLYEGNIKSNGVIASYYSATHSYSWYVLLLLFAILSSIYILRWEDPIFLAPILFFLANCAFLTISNLVSPRYIENFDVLLILQSTLGLSLFLRRIKVRFMNINNKNLDLPASFKNEGNTK